MEGELVRLCINPYCGTVERENPDIATNCEDCGGELLVHKIYTANRLISIQGGFGTIFELEDAAKQQKILKVLKPIFNNDSRTVELFQQEVSLLQQIDTPAFPKIEAYIHHPLPDGSILHGIVMEKIAGCNLQEWQQSKRHEPISQAMAITWLREIVRSLDLIHKQNYFHRDIKPANIMLDPSGRLVLIDFGSARHESSTYLDKLYGGGGITRISSLGYTAPEQERGFAVPQSDFYALGMTFIDLLTGKYPLDMYESNTDIYHWRQFVPDITPAFADLLDSTIATKPIERPYNCEIILHILDEIANPTALSDTSTPEAAPLLNRVGIRIGVAIVGALGLALAAYYRLFPTLFPQPAPATSPAARSIIRGA
jgi:serine/threonine protein kinase